LRITLIIFFILKKNTKYKNSKKYPFILLENKKIKKYVITYLSKGFIVISFTFYTILILFVKKPGSKIRFCINYRKFNSITKKNTHPIPFIK
jgi:hypothetical protein